MEIRHVMGVVGAMCLGTVVTELIYHYIFKMHNRKIKNEQGKSSVIGTGSGTVKTWFFPDSHVACKDHFIQRNGCTNQRCRFSHDPHSSYGQLLRYIYIYI